MRNNELALTVPSHGKAMVLLAILAPLISGCWAARSAGNSLAAGAIARLESEDSAFIAFERQLADSAGAFLSREFATAVLQPAEQTWRGMSQGVREEADSVATRLAAQLRGNLNTSLQELMRDNLNVLDRRATDIARAMMDALTQALGSALTTELAAAGDTLTVRFVTAVALGLEEVLRPALHTVMLDIRDSLRLRITDVDRAVAESRTVSGLRYALVGGGSAIGLAVLFAALVHWHRQRRALHAMIDAVETVGDDGVRNAVQTCSERAGVRGWLTDQVAARKRPKER